MICAKHKVDAVTKINQNLTAIRRLARPTSHEITNRSCSEQIGESRFQRSGHSLPQSAVRCALALTKLPERFLRKCDFQSENPTRNTPREKTLY